MTLTEFLLARIAEDEQAVEPHRDYMEWVPLGAIESGDGYAECSISAPRVLAECEAKHRIIELHSGPHNCENVTTGQVGWNVSPCTTLELLALPYAGHPDYQQEWRP